MPQLDDAIADVAREIERIGLRLDATAVRHADELRSIRADLQAVRAALERLRVAIEK